LLSFLLGYPDYGVMVVGRGDHFRFGSVFIKKITKPNFFFKKTETEPNPVQTDQFRFSFLGQKPVQTGLAQFFQVFFGLVRLGFFSFRLIKLKPNRTKPVGILKILIGFFSRFGFFGYFFLFSRFNQFFSFFAHS